MPMILDRERDWALYTKSTGGEWLTHWHQDDKDTFEYEGVAYSRIGPVARAYTAARAEELIRQQLPGQ
jgi:hypothetical protein